MKPTIILDMAGQIRLLTFDSNPIEHGTLKTLGVIGMSGADAFLQLYNSSADINKGRGGASHHYSNM